MPLTLFQKQDNRIKRLINKCKEDSRYAIIIVARNIQNIHDKKAHEYYLTVFKNGKKLNSYPLLREVYEKYVAMDCFKITNAGQNTCASQYYN
jgi:vacuolar-type H+-ATPase subunit F/Vma7